MRWRDRHRRSPARPKLRPCAVCALAGLVLAGGLAGGQVACADAPGPTLLSDAEMDSVTAGAITMDLELSADAAGPAAMTSTTGSVTIGHATGLRIAVDPEAPPEAQARLVGTVDVEVGIAVGKAQAAGADGATCSAKVSIAGADTTTIAQSQNFTAIAATCACTAMAVGFLTH